MKTRSIVTIGLVALLVVFVVTYVSDICAAPTYRVYATREGLVGYRTANGHLIVPNDHFVALPSDSVLNPLGGYTYTVNIVNPANGYQAANVPVWDLGPWNLTDNYWHNPRVPEFSSIAVGTPAAEVQYYNGWVAQNGYIPSNPAGIDLADGTHADLGGVDGWMDVTFNWEPDPITNPPYYFTNNIQGWKALNGVSELAWVGGSWPGCMYFDQTANDSQILSPNTSFVGVSGETLSVRVYPQSGNSASHDMKLYWKISDEAYFDEAKSTPVVNYTAQNQWATVNLNLNNPKWVGKTITALRLDFDTTNHNTRFIVDSITRTGGVVPDIIIDNPQGSCSANWATSTSSTQKYGTNYRWRSTQAISDPFTWTPNITTAGNYEVYAWWPAGTNRHPQAPYVINYNGGSASAPRNQQLNGGKWNSLGIYNFAAGTTGNVKLSCWASTGYVVCADAVKFVKR